MGQQALARPFIQDVDAPLPFPRSYCSHRRSVWHCDVASARWTHGPFAVSFAGSVAAGRCHCEHVTSIEIQMQRLIDLTEMQDVDVLRHEVYELLQTSKDFKTAISLTGLSGHKGMLLVSLTNMARISLILAFYYLLTM